MPDVDAYLIHWNAPEWCAATVQSLLGSDGIDVKVTVINNGGRLHLPGSVETVDTGHNLGFTGAANLALASASPGRWLLVGCHDAKFEPEALQHLVRMMERDPGLAVVGPALDGAGDSSSELEWVSGTAMLIRPEVAQQYRFDQRYGSYVEDVDFCCRIREDGWRIGRAGAARVQTNGSVDRPKAVHLTQSNMMMFFTSRRMWRRAAGEAWGMLRRGHILSFGRGVWQCCTFPLRAST